MADSSSSSSSSVSGASVAVKPKPASVPAFAHIYPALAAIFALQAPFSSLDKVDWAQLDINFVSCDGQLRAWPLLLKLAKSTLACKPGVQQTLIAKLLEFKGPQQQSPFVQTESSSSSSASSSVSAAVASSSAAPFEPADADELLHHFALELVSPGSAYTQYQLLPDLIRALHARGFDLDRRDRQGRTLLGIHALQCEWAPAVQQLRIVNRQHTYPMVRPAIDVEPVVPLLLKLGASALQLNTDGATLFDVWTHAGRADLLEAALMDKVPLQGLQLRGSVERWIRDAGAGKSVAELLVPAAATSSELFKALLLHQLNHWQREAHTLQQALLHDLTHQLMRLPSAALTALLSKDRQSTREVSVSGQNLSASSSEETMQLTFVLVDGQSQESAGVIDQQSPSSPAAD